MILVTGSLAFDYIMDFAGRFADHILPDKIHLLNLSFMVSDLKKGNGGTAGNIAYNLALLGALVTVMGTVGEDFVEYERFLKNSGVDTSGIEVIDGESTALAFIVTDRSDNQIAGFYPGALRQAQGKQKIRRLKTKPSLVVVSPNNPEAMVDFVNDCQELKIPYLYDPGMQLPRLSDDQLREGVEGAKILIGNDYETSLIKNRLKLNDGQLPGKVEIMITTLGERGAKMWTKEKAYKIKPAKPENVSDPTGAGDAFRAGFLAGYTRGFDLKTCGQIGAVAACYTVEKYGTTTHSFTVEQFCQRYKENFGEEIKI